MILIFLFESQIKAIDWRIRRLVKKIMKKKKMKKHGIKKIFKYIFDPKSRKKAKEHELTSLGPIFLINIDSLLCTFQFNPNSTGLF